MTSFHIKNSFISRSQNADTFTVIHSVKSRATCTNAPWIRLTRRILSKHDPKKEVLVTSAGMLHYDIVLREWMHMGGFSRVILHRAFEKWPQKLKSLYQWLINDPKIDIIQPVESAASGKNKQKEQYLLRDRLVIHSASFIDVGCLNPDGRMFILLKTMKSQQQFIRHWRLSKEDQSLPDIYKTPSFDLPEHRGAFDDYIWHFTRTRFGPWPDNSMADYLDNLLGHGGSAPYTALTVLKRILSEKRIRSSKYLVRGHTPVVCFSGAPWKIVRTLFTWQNHLRRFRFEPYALGIAKSDLKSHGIYPVIYAPETDYLKLRPDQRWRFQKFDRFSAEWIDEAEWRCRNDLSLSALKNDSLAILTMTGMQSMNSWQ